MPKASEKTKSIYRRSYKLKVKTFEKELDSIKFDAFKEIGNTFDKNMKLIGFMVSLPVIICAMNNMEFNNILVDIEARLSSGVLDLRAASEEEKRKYFESIKSIWKAKYEPKKKQLVDEAIEAGEESFSKIIEDINIYEPYRSLLYAGIVFTWCSFEVCMKDVWETALNTGNKLVIKTALRNISSVDKINNFSGIQGKYINLDYLAQYNYNVANKLGSILVNKYDFSSVYGIKDAYSYAFPRSTTIKEAFENNELLQLEARRHVIVHKAGVIDANFCKKTGTSKKQIGNKLELNDEELFEFGNVAIDVAIRVIKAVSAILSGGKVSS